MSLQLRAGKSFGAFIRQKRWWLVGLFLALFVTASFPPAVLAQGVPGRVLAPELEGATDYINSDKPIHLKDLRGKIVILDFWTLC